MFGFRPHHNKSLLQDPNESCLTMIMDMGLRIMKPVTVPCTGRKNMAITFSLVVPRKYKKTLVSLLTHKSHSVTSNPVTLKFCAKLIRYE
ncbi:hypothetical protein Hanom_Chr11g01041641 [Helianthus anomalus]